jgi:bifunctional UDP-N-acetylglucosamine pyrophosphorylase / glucosamine-1-phosphate N-acetyltransferase
MPRSGTAIILAAGLGTRMKSALPKALHPIAGWPMLRHLLASAEKVFERIVVVVGPDMEAVEKVAAPHPTVIQRERLGTAHAAVVAAPLFGDGIVTILYADNPLVTAATLNRLQARRSEDDVGLALLATRAPDPTGYGRLIGSADFVERIVEWSDATSAERAQELCNAGGFCADGGDMARWLHSICSQPRPSQKVAAEYYLTDIVALATAAGRRVTAVEVPFKEARGINSRAELAAAEATMQGRLRSAAMAAGVTMIDPGSVFLSADTRLARDVTIGPNVVFGAGVVIESGAEIRAFSHLEGCSIGPGALVGPFARLRPGTVLGEAAHVGNFVELKAARLGSGAKANHLTYLGDTEIGAGTNIGAGTITCNYDGFTKHRTTIGEGVFIGSNTALVAPVAVGDGAMVAAGSVITENVSPDALAIARARQVEKPGRAAEFRVRQQHKLGRKKQS